jgi:hypothetical protein
MEESQMKRFTLLAGAVIPMNANSGLAFIRIEN